MYIYLCGNLSSIVRLSFEKAHLRHHIPVTSQEVIVLHWRNYICHSIQTLVCVCVCVCAYVYGCVRVCVRACMRVCKVRVTVRCRQQWSMVVSYSCNERLCEPCSEMVEVVQTKLQLATWCTAWTKWKHLLNKYNQHQKYGYDYTRDTHVHRLCGQNGITTHQYDNTIMFKITIKFSIICWNRPNLLTHASLVCLCSSCKFLSNLDRFEFCPSHWGNSGRPRNPFMCSPGITLE